MNEIVRVPVYDLKVFNLRAYQVVYVICELHFFISIF